MTLDTMDRHDVVAALKKRFRSVAAFERAQGLPEKSVNDVLRGKPRVGVAEAIEDALRTPVPSSVSEVSDDNTDQSAAHRQNAGAR